jgi:hypothetical protein
MEPNCRCHEIRPTHSIGTVCVGSRTLSASTSAPQYVDDEDGVRQCYAIMRQLRPHLSSPDELVARWRRQLADGYRLLAQFDGSRVIALAGFRVQENLVHGR